MYYDYHMHCNFSIDSNTKMEDMIKKSMELNLKEICFTDHSDYSILVNNVEEDVHIEVSMMDISYFVLFNVGIKILIQFLFLKKHIKRNLKKKKTVYTKNRV